MTFSTATIKLHLLAILITPSFAVAKLDSGVSMEVHQKTVELNNFFSEKEVQTHDDTLFGNVSHANVSISKRKEEETVYMEPRVDRYASILPQAVCQQLIKLGESAGFTVVEESIDEEEVGVNPEKKQIPSQSIDVFDYVIEEDRSYIANFPIYLTLQPYFKMFADLVKNSRKREEQELLYPGDPDREPRLDWIFFRKYSPTSDRNSLMPHHDSNVYTLNIALNDDFEGGGLFYIKPEEQEITAPDTRPVISEYMETYNWTNSIKRENTSDVVFPDMKAGDVLIHNFTVMHGVAPLEKGERYSIALFYDMDNPIIDDMKDEMIPTSFNADVTSFDADITSFDVEFYHEIQDVKIKLMYVEWTVIGEMIEEVMVDEFRPFERLSFDTYEGHTFRAVVEGTKEVLTEFVANKKQKSYLVVRDAVIQHHEL